MPRCFPSFLWWQGSLSGWPLTGAPLRGAYVVESRLGRRKAKTEKPVKRFRLTGSKLIRLRQPEIELITRLLTSGKR